MIKELSGLKRRIRILFVERYALIGGSIGSILACLLVLFSTKYDVLLDYGLWIAAVIAGIAAGAVYGVLKKLDNLLVAIESDRRSGLKERMSTAYLVETGKLAAGVDNAIIADASEHASGLKPAEVFPHKLGRPHILFTVAMVLLIGLIVIPQLSLFQSKARKIENAAMAAEGKKLVRVAKDLRKQDVPEKEELRRLAKKLDSLGKKMQTGRMEKKQAMLKLQKLNKQTEKMQEKLAKANPADKTMDQAGKEIASKTPELAQKIAEQIAKEKNMPKLDAMKQVPTDKRMAELARKQGPLTDSERKELENLVQKYSKPGNTAAIPSELAEALAKLMQNKDYQKATEIMQQLAKKLNLQGNKMSKMDQKMLQEQLKAMAEALKNTDLNELAKQMRENAEKLAKMSPEELKKMIEEMQKCQNMAKACKSCKNACMALAPGGLCNSGGVGMGTGGSPAPGGGFGADNANTGPHGKINDVKTAEKVTSQVGESGMVFSSGESKGAPDQVGAAKVPYTAVMPGYKKAAEDSLQRDQVPPAYRKRVKDYFGSLQ